MYHIILDLNKSSKTNKRVYSLAKLGFFCFFVLFCFLKDENQVFIKFDLKNQLKIFYFILGYS